MTARVALVDPGKMGNPFKACPGHYREYLAHLGTQVHPGQVLYSTGQCAGCAANGTHPLAGEAWPMPGDKMNARQGALRKRAHDSGDGATIFHCPFCGSGQVLARSDRTIECEYCHTCFTVQVQPQFPAFPQTIDGMPMQVPGMPGEVGGPPAAPGGGMPGGMPEDPNADPMAAPGEDPMAEDGGEPPEDPEDAGAPPFAKGSMLRTASGAALSMDSYLKHLAIKFAPSEERDAVIERVRTERQER